jgi:crotonobetainyl-CoA:carnitine CoA-transferase CaiB-like acyl-CoA transferase
MTGPLHGLTVLELAEGVAGPCLGEFLALAGADVIKVESPAGDCSRGWVPALGECLSGPFVALNRGKRSVRVDPAGGPPADVVTGLLAWADVVIADDTAPAATWFGGAARARSVNPRSVYCVLSGYGPDGPSAGEPAGDLPAELMSGAFASLGRIGEPPVRMPGGYPSTVAAAYATQAVTAALFERETSGRGQVIDVSLLGGMIAMRSTLWMAQSDPDEWWGFHLDNAVKAPFHGYPTATGPAYVAVGGAAFGNGLAEELGIEWIRDDPRYPTILAEGMSPGSRHTDELSDIWGPPLAGRSLAEVTEIITRYGGQVQPANTYAGLARSEAAAALGLTAEFDQPGVGALRGLTAPWNFDDGDPLRLGGAPLLGEHTDDVLAGLPGPARNRET